jgi:hypothetical protein
MENMPWTPMDEHFRLAAYERISRLTVGIASNKNTNVGTGVLVRRHTARYILTAAHVVRDSTPDSLRFWLRPPAPMKEKAAKHAENWEIGHTTEGTSIPVVLDGMDVRTDIAVLSIDPAFHFPEGPALYRLDDSREFMTWPDDKLNGTTLYLFGFPVENSRVMKREGENVSRLLGASCLTREYSSDLNKTGWRLLPSSVSPSKDCLIEYGIFAEIEPYGFSGCGVWVMGETPGRTVWGPDPLLIGVTHSYHRKSDVLIATKISSVIEFTPE